VVRGDGGISSFNGSAFVSVFNPTDGRVTALSDLDGLLVAGFDDGSVGVLADTRGGLVELARQATGFEDQPSALEALRAGDELEVYVSTRGQDTPVILSFGLIPLLTDVPTAGSAAQGTSLLGADFVLVATLQTGGLVEGLSSDATVFVSTAEGLALFLPRPTNFSADIANSGGADNDENVPGESVLLVADVGVPVDTSAAPPWKVYRIGAAEALRRQQLILEVWGYTEDVLDGLMKTLQLLRSSLKEPSPREDEAEAGSPPERNMSAVLSAEPPVATTRDAAGEQEEMTRSSPEGFGFSEEGSIPPALDFRLALVVGWLTERGAMVCVTRASRATRRDRTGRQVHDP